MQIIIYCLQDTHFTTDTENIIRNEWGYQIYFNSFRSNSRGVAILFNNNFEFKVIKEKKGSIGNFLALVIEICNVKSALIHMYGPNSDTLDFYEKIPETISDCKNDYHIICGDFNLILNAALDYE